MAEQAFDELANKRETFGACVYMAGKVAKQDWRGEVLGHGFLRGADGSEDWRLHWDKPFPGWTYVGPFFTSCDHGCGHGDRLHGCGAVGGSCYEGCEPIVGAEHSPVWDKSTSQLTEQMRQHVRRQCEEALREADVVFAWIEDLTAHGTIWELGFAAALRKPIWVAHPPGADLSELWLSQTLTNVIEATSPKEAFSVVRGHYEAEARLAGLPESPIERRLMNVLRGFFVDFDAELDAWAHGTLRFRPQVRACDGRYRLDMAVWDTVLNFKLAIECDGHDFHERTPEQATRDKSRDRDLVIDGWTVLRFTGREITRDTVACRDQIMDAAMTLARTEIQIRSGRAAE